MRRAALAGGLIVLLLGALLAVPFLTRERDLLTTTPQPQPLTAVALVQLGGGQQACLDQAVIDERSEQVRFRVATYRKRGVPLGVAIRGRGYRDAQRVAARYSDNELLSLPIAAPRAPLLATICVRNEGSRKIALYASEDRTRSRSKTTVDGARVEPNVVIQFAQARPESLLDHLPVVFRRLTIFRPVGQWLTWPLLILFAIGIPLAMMTAFVRSAGSVEAEDARAAAARERALEARGAAPREGGSRLERIATAPGTWLAAIVGVVFMIGAGYALSLVQYFVMPDELGYVKQATHLASTLLPSRPGDMWFNSYSQLWPLTIAPAYGIFDTPTAFDVAHLLAAAAIASTAIPVYLLAGRVVGRPAGRLFAAALTIVVPWLAFSGTVMTESLAYPLFTWALLAMTRAVERPSPLRDAVALGAIGLVFLTRVQLGALGAAFVAAIVLHELTFSGEGRRARDGLRRRLSRHWLLLAVCAAGGLFVVAGYSMRTVVGGYALATEGGVVFDGVVAQARELLAYIALGVCVLPLALAPAWMLLELTRPRDGAAHALAAVSLTTILTIVIVSATFSARFTTGVNDRYLFFIVPLLAIGCIALLYDRRPATLPLLAGGAFAALVFATATLGAAGPSAVSPTYAINTVVQGRGAQVANALGLGGTSPADLIAGATLLFVVALAVARRRRPGTQWIAVGVSVSLLFVSLLATRYVLKTIKQTQVGASQAFIDGRPWVDLAAPGSRVGAVLSFIDDPAVTTASWWDVNFWNKRVDRIYVLPGGSLYDQGFARTTLIDPVSGRMAALDERPLLVIGTADRRFALRGARTIGGVGPFALVRAPRPYRAAWSLTAARDDGLLPAGTRGRLTLFGDGRRARRLRVRVSAAATADATRGYRLVARSSSGREWSVGVAKGAGGTLGMTVRVPAVGATRLRLSLRGRASKAAPEAGVIIDGVVSRPG